MCVATLALAAGCGGSNDAIGGTDNVPPPSDPRPEKLDGTESTEFEREDIEAAENASPEVQAYCSGAVSEAQYQGCLSHVDEAP